MTRLARWGLALLLPALALGGCRAQAPRLPPACVEGARPILRALERAPGPVALADGTRLSDCVTQGIAPASAQELGFVLTAASDALARRAHTNERAALRLGYLAGAVQRGASRTNGAQAELARRLSQDGGFDTLAPAARAAYASGLASGARTG